VINFNWGAEQDLIPNVAREYVSIEWVGFLMPLKTGDHEFFMEVDDGVRLWINDKLLIDRMIDAP
jgi:hypothetical protein